MKGNPRQPRPNQIRLNEMIRRPEVRVINPDGQQLGIYPIRQAISIAQELGLDLVEINPKADPPVCRIMDFGKFKYEQKKQAAVAKKKQKVIEIKEVKMRPKTDTHDFDFKIKHVRRFLGEGDKAKLTIRFKGREMAHPEMAARQLDKVVEACKDIAIVEQPYRMEGRTMTMILAPAPNRTGSLPTTPRVAKGEGEEESDLEILPPLEDLDDDDDDDDEDDDEVDDEDDLDDDDEDEEPPPPKK